MICGVKPALIGVLLGLIMLFFMIVNLSTLIYMTKNKLTAQFSGKLAFQLAAVILMAALPAHAQVGYTFVPTGSAPAGDVLSATIVLDSSSSSGGTIWDVAEIAWGINGPTYFTSWGSVVHEAWDASPGFTWAPDTITEMNLVENVYGGFFDMTQGSISVVGFGDTGVPQGGVDTQGYWVNSGVGNGVFVPDHNSTAILFFSTVALLFSVHHRLDRRLEVRHAFCR